MMTVGGSAMQLGLITALVYYVRSIFKHKQKPGGGGGKYRITKYGKPS